MGFAETLSRLMDERGISANALAAQVACDKALIARYRNGRQHPSPRMARRVDEVLGAGGQLAALAGEAPVDGDDGGSGDKIGAFELARRAAATDVGTATMERLERAVDSLAIGYPGTAPAALLRRVRAHLGYVTTLLDARKTLTEHRRLLTVGSWLSLLAEGFLGADELAAAQEALRLHFPRPGEYFADPAAYALADTQARYPGADLTPYR